MCHCSDRLFARLQKHRSLTATTCTTSTSWPCMWTAKAADRRSTSRPTCAASSRASTTPSSSPNSTSSAVDPSKAVTSTSKLGAYRTAGVGSSALSYARSWSTSKRPRIPTRPLLRSSWARTPPIGRWRSYEQLKWLRISYIYGTRDTNVTSSESLLTFYREGFDLASLSRYTAVSTYDCQATLCLTQQWLPM